MVELDENGFMRGFPYHDGRLEGVSLRGADVDLALRSVEGVERVLTLREVFALSVDGFRENNIVHTMRVLAVDAALRDSTIRQSMSERVIVELSAVDRARRVFVLESSYGASVIALCGDVEVAVRGAA